MCPNREQSESSQILRLHFGYRTDGAFIIVMLTGIAVALSGFSGIIVSDQHSSASKTRTTDLVGVTMIIVMGLGVAIFLLFCPLYFLVST